MHNTRSDLGTIHSGVPQGAIIAPHLFNCFMFDFPLQGENSNSLLYADDALLYASSNSPITAMHNAEQHLKLTSMQNGVLK